jgi:hypothetical protein
MLKFSNQFSERMRFICWLTLMVFFCVFKAILFILCALFLLGSGIILACANMFSNERRGVGRVGKLRLELGQALSSVFSDVGRVQNVEFLTTVLKYDVQLIGAGVNAVIAGTGLFLNRIILALFILSLVFSLWESFRAPTNSNINATIAISVFVTLYWAIVLYRERLMLVMEDEAAY